MVNIVFSPVVEGSLHASVDPATNKRTPSEDLICLDWALDIGTLHDGIDSKYRIELPGRLIMEAYYHEHDYDDFPKNGERSYNHWKRLMDKIAKKETIRIWYDESPSALCGFYHVCSALCDYGGEVYTVTPNRLSSNDLRFFLTNRWGCFDQFSFGEHFGVKKRLENAEIRLYADKWNELVNEDAPLRASISGFPVSVSEDFYDSFLIESLSNEPIYEAKVIGNTMEKYDFGISVCWYEHRIQHMIDEGKVVVVEEAPKDKDKMHRIIQLVS